jgi:hypothetical protein
MASDSLVLAPAPLRGDARFTVLTNWQTTLVESEISGSSRKPGKIFLLNNRKCDKSLVASESSVVD